ncbi:hypothetical protein AYO40_03470 [Planctomycetaceae bacterium SCGC AG-212-D15]|nr:hypothetical protein AYO40_03470 [Planctomycetaceae bacterium SCGC AG-212-D15]
MADKRFTPCTPEALDDFIKRCLAVNGRQPTLFEIKDEFGGILGAIVNGWELERRKSKEEPLTGR